MSRLSHWFDRRRDESMPILLPSFFIAMLAAVAAVVAIGRTGSDLVDIGAVAILALALAVLVAIAWLLGWFDRERHAESEPRLEEPAWWSEFERQFEDYLSSRD